jgi:hypothetical protein
MSPPRKVLLNTSHDSLFDIESQHPTHALASTTPVVQASLMSSPNVVVEDAGVNTHLRVVGSSAAVETLLATERIAAASDIAKAIVTEVALPVAGLAVEWAIWYLTEHIKASQQSNQNLPYNQITPINDDWGQTIANFSLPIALAATATIAAYRDGNTAGLGLVGTAAAAGAGATFKALGFNDSLPLNGAARSAIHASLGMASSSLVKAGTYLAGSRLGTFFKKAENTNFEKEVVQNENNNLSETHYIKLPGKGV